MAFKSRRERFFKVSAVLIITITLLVLVFSSSARRRLYIVFSPKCINQKQAAFSSGLNDRVADYIVLARKSGIVMCRDEKALVHLLKKGQLVRIRSGRLYSVDRLTHSHPYLTRETRDLLDEIGKRFRKKTNGAGLRGSKFIITSMTRTAENLKGLRRSNSNASENSPHLNGNAFDISYVRFTSRKFFITSCDRRFFKEALAEVIYELNREKRCWATYERQQSCFHVVAR